jgi:hypothetical protein
MALSPEERALRGRIGALALHSKHDPKKTTQAARAAFSAKFEADVDPEGKLDPAERKRRAEYARKAHFARLALASARARREKAERKKGSGKSRIDDKTAGGSAVQSGEVRDAGAAPPR